MSGNGVELFLHAVEEKVKAKKRWSSLKRRRKLGKFKRKKSVGNSGNSGSQNLIKKKVGKKLVVAAAAVFNKKTDQEIEMMKMLNNQYIRDVSRADAQIALAGYYPSNGKLYETLMPLSHWLSMLHDLNLIGQGLSIREATWCFTWSLMHVKDELTEASKRSCLSFTDFLEAFGRLAELLPLPTLKEIMSSSGVGGGGGGGGENFVAMEHFNVSETLIQYVNTHQSLLLKAKNGQAQRRSSSTTMFINSKHRTLDQKLFVLLSVIWDKVEHGVRELHVSFHDGEGGNKHAFQ